MKYKCTTNVNSKKSKVTNTYVYVLYMSLAQSKNKRRLKKVKNLHVCYENDNLCYLLKFLKQYLDIENSIFLICLKNYN